MIFNDQALTALCTFVCEENVPFGLDLKNDFFFPFINKLLETEYNIMLCLHFRVIEHKWLYSSIITPSLTFECVKVHLCYKNISVKTIKTFRYSVDRKSRDYRFILLE